MPSFFGRPPFLSMFFACEEVFPAEGMIAFGLHFSQAEFVYRVVFQSLLLQLVLPVFLLLRCPAILREMVPVYAVEFIPGAVEWDEGHIGGLADATGLELD